MNCADDLHGATSGRPGIGQSYVFSKIRRTAFRGIRELILEPLVPEPIGFMTEPPLEDAMNNLAISLSVGASALFMTAASAAPLSADVSVAPESSIQQVRMVCNENGRCWRQRDERRVIIRDYDNSYGYAPRERYIERRGYDEDRSGGFGFRAPGVSIGIGTGY
jgi:hypothetical protein